MNDSISRRHFVGGGAALVATPALSNPIAQLLAPDKAEELVIETLETYSKIGRIDRTVAQEFIKRLMTPGLHTEDPATFKSWMEGGPGAEENLKAYILEEFVAHTNYFAVVEGYEKVIRFRALGDDSFQGLV
jgi:hypothetical protein